MTHTPLTLTEADVTAALEAAVAERGEDFVYTTEDGECYYSYDDGTPGCLIGVALSKLDPIAFEQLVDYELSVEEPYLRRTAGSVRAVVAEINTFPVNAYDRPIVARANPELLAAMSVAQETQDVGGSWGNALKAYQKSLADAALANDGIQSE